MCNSKDSFYLRGEIVGSRSIYQIPFSARRRKKLRGASNWSKQQACRRIWQEWFDERLPPANWVHVFAALCSCESHRKWLKQKAEKFSRQSETQPSNQFLWISEPGIAGPETWRKLVNLTQPTYLPGPIPLKRTAQERRHARPRYFISLWASQGLISVKTSLLNTCHTRLKIQSSRCRGRRRTRNSALSQRSNCFTLRESNREVKRAEFCDRVCWLARRTRVLFRSLSELALQHKWPGPTHGFRANWLAKSDQVVYAQLTPKKPWRSERHPSPVHYGSEAAAICRSRRWQLTAWLTNQLLSSPCTHEVHLEFNLHNLPSLTVCNNLCLCDMGTSHCASH